MQKVKENVNHFIQPTVCYHDTIINRTIGLNSPYKNIPISMSEPWDSDSQLEEKLI